MILYDINISLFVVSLYTFKLKYMSNIEEINGKKTLVYFASGPYKNRYELLPYDQIYLVDYCFIGKGNRNNGSSDRKIQISESGKVFCLGQDCLQAVSYLKQRKIKIDTFISLNEGLYEGGKGGYALNSDMFLGYVMPLLSDDYIHIMNKTYYCNQFHVTMDLPYLMTEIKEGDKNYLDPFLFSDDEYHKNHAKVYRMKKQTSAEDLNINPNIQISIIQDSIWNHADELDLIAISITPQGQGDFFLGLNKVISLRDHTIGQILDFCVREKIERIGFTPWAKNNYSSFIDQIKNHTKEYPNKISLFHLNKRDFNSLKVLA